MSRIAIRWITRVCLVVAILSMLAPAPQAVARPASEVQSLRVEALIDGRSQLIVHRNTVQWLHLDFAAPGRHEFQNEPTLLNGVEWLPIWPDVPDEENRACHCHSDVFSDDQIPRLPAADVVVGLRVIQSRSVTDIVQYPKAENDYTLIVEFDDNAPFGSEEYIAEVLFAEPPPILHLSTRQRVTIDDTVYRTEDILAHNLAGDFSYKFFDGSDVGLKVIFNNLNGFALMEDESFLITLAQSQVITDVGWVTPYDIIRFIPTQLGHRTIGSFEMFLKGSDVGLTHPGERIDAISWTPDHRLAISTFGPFSVPGSNGTITRGQDEDLIVADATHGFWEMYFDGSDVGLKGEPEDIRSLWIEPLSGQLYMTTDGFFKVACVTGEPNCTVFGAGRDVLVCTPISLGANTLCNFSVFWRGAEHGLKGIHIDALEFGSESSIPITRPLPGEAQESDAFEPDDITPDMGD